MYSRQYVHHSASELFHCGKGVVLQQKLLEALVEAQDPQRGNAGESVTPQIEEGKAGEQLEALNVLDMVEGNVEVLQSYGRRKAR